MPPSPITIRTASVSDAPALLSIYAPYVERTAITFEYTVPTLEDFRSRISRTLARYPYLVAECSGIAMGYAYASAFHPRAAYDWSAEVSIYVSEDARGTGIGTRLYGALEDILKQQNIINVNACIAYPNPGSISFHEKLGYRTVGHFTKCGYKLGKWWDMIWMEKILGDHPDVPGRLIPYPELGNGCIPS
ncbi:putative phosphinothricin N-acetyltransferase [Clostridiales bacterium 1_7_47FAA]|uniref:N-acetyltransferase family protein n=1 Tax=Enterocloster hominis (ex Hitch et al. 2024) TaxID=1917870 RepID=A0ABV1D331_9FIRM|nr:putative phosphinothricin N-acetyltransferase [Clostridiales bacterium 1_7_47FAA]